MLKGSFPGENPEDASFPRKSKVHKILIAGLFLFFALILGVGLFAYSRFLSPERQAYQRCQKEISDIVFSPDTAQYAPFGPETVSQSDAAHYVVNIPVKAQNKFGDLTSSKFTCYLIRSGLQWFVERIESKWDVQGVQE
jgi:hypothetical protein